jgi:hypothetical protein
MGCTRDRISVDLFSKNFVQLQQETGALISVIVFPEKSNNNLRNGLSYSEWLQQLSSAIVKYQQQISTMSSPAEEDSQSAQIATQTTEPEGNIDMRPVSPERRECQSTGANISASPKSQQPQMQCNKKSISDCVKSHSCDIGDESVCVESLPGHVSDVVILNEGKKSSENPVFLEKLKTKLN